MAMDITQLQAVLTARDEATPVLQNFLRLIQQARDAASGYATTTAAGVASTTPAWQAATEAAQQNIAALTQLPGVANAAAQSVTGIGQAATVSAAQTTAAVDAVSKSLGNILTGAKTAADSVKSSLNEITQTAKSTADALAQATTAYKPPSFQASGARPNAFGPSADDIKQSTDALASLGIASAKADADAKIAATSIVGSWRSASSQIDADAKTAADSIVTHWQAASSRSDEAAKTAATSIVGSWRSASSQADDAAKTAATSIVSNWTSAASQADAASKTVATGIVSSWRSASSQADEAARTAATGIVNSWKSTQGAADATSASTKTVAQNLAALGIASEQNRVSTQASTEAVKAHSEAWVSLGGIMSHLPGPLGEVGAAFGTIHEKITQAQASILALSAVATLVGVDMLVGLGGAVETAGHFESTFAQVKTVLEGTGETIDAFQEKALQLGVQTQFNSQKVAEGFYELTSAGLSVKESLAGIEPAIQAATLGHQALNTTTFALATTMRQFGLEASDMTRIVDVMARMAADSTLHWSEMSQVFRNVQGSAKFMNVSIEETGAALEVMANAATPATMAGTAFRTFLDRLSKGTGEAGAAMHALNLQMYDANGAFVGLLPIMQQIESATKNMTDAEKDGIIAKLGGARANALIRDTLNAKKDVEIEGQTVTLRGTEVLAYFIQRNQEAQGAATRMFEITKQTFEFQRDVANASIQEAAIRIGNQLLPALTAVLPVFTSVVNAFIQAPPAIHAASTAMTVVAGTALTLVGTVGTLSVIWPLLSAAFTAIAGAASEAALSMGALGLATTLSTATIVTSLLPLSAAITALVVASGVLAVAWSNDWGNIQEHTKEATDGIGTYLKQVQTDIDVTQRFMTGLGNQSGNAIGNYFSRLGSAVQEDTVVQGITAAVGGPAAMTAITGAAIHGGEIFIEEFVKSMISHTPMAVALWADSVRQSVEKMIPFMQQASAGMFTLDPKEMLAQVRDDEARELDQLAFAAVDKIRHGADMQSAAWGELWTRMDVEGVDGITNFGSITRENFELVMGRIRQLLKMPGIEEEVANVLGNVEDAYSASMRRLMANNDNDIGKALKEAIAEGSQRQATEFLNVEAGQKLIKAAIQGTNTDFEAQVRIMERASTEESAYAATKRTLEFLVSTGNVTEREYGQFLAGTTIEHEKAKTAAQQTAAERKAVTEATKAATHTEQDYLASLTAGQKLYEQTAGKLATSITSSLSLPSQMKALDVLEGLPSTEKLQRLVTASGTKINLADLYYGDPKSVQDRVALIVAALEGGGIQNLPAHMHTTAAAAAAQAVAGVREQVPAAKQASTELGGAVATGVAEQAPAAQVAGETVGSAVNTGITTSLTRRPFDVSEMLAHLESLKKYGVPVATDAGTAIGDGVDQGVQDAIQPSDAKQNVDDYIQGLDAGFQADNTVAASAGVMATGADKAVADVISPERASELAIGWIDSLGTTFANTPVPPEDVEKTVLSLRERFRDGLSAGILTEEYAATLIKQANINLAQAAANNPDIKNTGKAIDTGIGEGAQENADSELAPVLAGAIDTATGAVSDHAQTKGRENVGQPLVTGIAQGIRSTPEVIQGAVQEIIDVAIAAAKSKAGITSPSSVMAEEIGLPLAQGIGLGFLSGIGGVKAQVQGAVADLVSGAGGELSRGMGSLIADVHSEIAQQLDTEIKKPDTTAPESALNLGERVVAPNPNGFAPLTIDDVAKLMNYPELSPYMQGDKSYPGLQRTFQNPKTLEKGYSIGDINFGYGDDNTTVPGIDPYNPYPGETPHPQDTTIARFSPGFGGLGRATGGFDLQGALDRLVTITGNLSDVAAQQVTYTAAPKPLGPTTSYQGGIQHGAPDMHQAGESPYWGEFYAQRPDISGQPNGIADWNTWLAARLGPPVATYTPPEGMTYAQAVNANPYNVGNTVPELGPSIQLPAYEPPATIPLNPANLGSIPIYGPPPSRQIGGQAALPATYAVQTGSRQFTTEEVASIVASVANMRTPSYYGPGFQGDTIPADVGGLESFLQHYRDQGVDVQPYTGPSGPNFRNPPAAPNYDLAQELGQAATELVREIVPQFGALGEHYPPASGGLGTSLTNLDSEAYYRSQRADLGLPYGASDTEVRLAYQAQFQQAQQRAGYTGNIPSFSGYVSMGAGNGPWIGAGPSPFGSSLGLGAADQMQMLTSSANAIRRVGDSATGLDRNFLSVRESATGLGLDFTRLDGAVLSQEEHGRLLMATQGQYLDQFGKLQSALVDVTAQFRATATTAQGMQGDIGDLETSFQSASDLFAGEGGSGLSSGYGGKFFPYGENGALLPGNVNPNDYTARGSYGVNPYASEGPYSPFTAGRLGYASTPGNPMGFGPAAGLMAQVGMPYGSMSSQQFLDDLQQAVYQANLKALGPQGAPSPLGYYQSQMEAFNKQQGVGAAPQGQAGQSGSGFAQAQTAMVSPQGGVDFGDRSIPTAAGTLSAITANIAQYNAMMAQEAKDLASNVSLVSLSWSSIADISKYIAGSISTVAGAFSAIPGIDLNTAMASSITGSYVKPTFGGPSGPNPVMGSSDNGNTAGSIAAWLTTQAGNQIIAQNGGQVPQDFQQQLVKSLQGQKVYTDVVGQTTETTADLQQQQKDLTDRVFQLQSEADSLGGAYAAGTGVMDQLNAAQAELAGVVSALAGSVSTPTAASTGGKPTPVPLTVTTGDNGQVVIGGQNYPAGTTYNPLTGNIIPPGGIPITGGISTTPSPVTGTPTTTPTTTTSTTGSTTSTSTTRADGAILVGQTPTENIWKLINGQLQHVAKNPTTTPIPAPPLSDTTAIARPVTASGDIPLRGAASQSASVRIGDVHVTMNGVADPLDPTIIAKFGKLLREEMRRQGVDLTRVGTSL